MKKPSMDAYPESWLPKSARPDQKSEPEPLNLHARIQDFLVRIQPLSPDLRSHGRTRALALQKLHRICAREVRNLKAKFTLATVKYYLSQYRDAIRASDPNHLVLRPRRMRSGQRFSYLALDPEETRSLNAAYQSSIHRDQSKLIPLDADAFIEKARSLLSSSSYLEKGIALMALTGRRPGEIFFSAKFVLSKKKFAFPALIFEGQLKTRNAPGTSFQPYPIPVLAEPKLIIAELAKLMPDSEIGKHAVAGYSRYLGISKAEFVQGMESPPTASDVATAAIELVTNPDPSKGNVFVVWGKGLEAVP